MDFQDVYDAFQPRIRRYLSRVVGASDAEDLTQEVFVKVSQALPHFRGDSKISTWLYRIATNTALDRLRSAAVPRARRVPFQAAQSAPDKRPGAEQDVLRAEMNDCIRQYVERLPPSYRAVVILSEHEELTNQEIADAVGISLDTVKIRLHRARARLKRELGGGCRVYRDDRSELACEPKPEGEKGGQDIEARPSGHRVDRDRGVGRRELQLLPGISRREGD